MVRRLPAACLLLFVASTAAAQSDRGSPPDSDSIARAGAAVSQPVLTARPDDSATPLWQRESASASTSQSVPLVLLVRHAERADTGTAAASTVGTDPDLSQVGHTRAEALARLLKDARITAIYTTELKRTQQTAAPLARALGLDPEVVPAARSADLVRMIGSAAGVVLVVGHSNTVPELIRDLGVKEAVSIAEGEFDNLFVVVRGAATTLLRLRY